ncbi:Mov34/MPN/PAD-1 family protein [Sphingomonas bacterium]|uniref:Mov34/MPN/PAD-1 family protein n=1 Tax=Sphingomonas bacterium TaxID=1895847 RepID=UPI00157636DA|nr:M67 family metallopeptidase [Sphingomonas bacterium]
MDAGISSELAAAILAHAAASPGVEVCGLLLGRNGCVDEARACRNVAADPSRRFEIDPAALLAVHREARAGGPAILGCYHSHPSGSAEPSACDAVAAEPNGWIWVIVAGTDIRAWRAVPQGERHGRFDAVALRD